MSHDLTAAARQRLLEEGQAALLERRAALLEQTPGFCQPDSATDPGQASRTSQSDPICQKSGFLIEPIGQKPGFCRPDTGGDPDPKSRASSLVEAVAALPAHQTFYSARVTAVLRAALANQSRREENPAAWLDTLRSPAFSDRDAPATLNQKAGLLELTIYPSLALAILRRKLAGPGRLWHLLRALDKNGRGWLSHDAARAAFTTAGAPLRFCGPRQLRNLLAGGDGTFWDDDGERLWLRAPAKVAAGLGVARLDGRAVAAPVSAFTGGIAAVRAHLYASFHSGRDGAPVARRTIAAKSGVAPRTQRAYDRRANVGRAANFARGPRLDTDAAEALAWRKGPACFTWTDQEGTQGAKGARYLAWQLPNSYTGPHQPRSRRAGKRIQRHLADLLTQGTAGNDQEAAGTPRRAYFSDAKTAVAAHAATHPPAHRQKPGFLAVGSRASGGKKPGFSAPLVYWPQATRKAAAKSSYRVKGQFWYVLW